MADGPVCVMGKRVDGFDRHHRSLKGGHAIETQRYDHELQDGIGTQFVPGAGQGHDTVDHSAPTRGQQDQREDHSKRLQPVRNCRVMQVMRTGPHVSGNQRPEVHDGQAIGINRALCLLRHKVVHHCQETDGEEKAHRVMPVPPLNYRIDCTGINRVGLGHGDRYGKVIDDMQQGDGQNETAIKPVGDVDMIDSPFRHRAEKNNRIRHPDQGDRQVDGPLEFSIFLALRDAERERNGGRNDNQLPAPEYE